MRAYDFDTGALLWEAAGLGENSIPQPVQHDDLVFAMSGHTIRMLMAIRLGRRGNLTATDADRMVDRARCGLHSIPAAARGPAVRHHR